MSVRHFVPIALATTVFGAAANAQTLHYQGSAVTGDSVTVDLSVLDRLGPPPSLPQLLRPGSVTPEALTPPAAQAEPQQGVAAQRTARLRQPPADAPKSSLNVPSQQPDAAAPARPAPAPTQAPRAAAPKPPAPKQPPPRVATAPADAKPADAPAARKPPPPPKVEAVPTEPAPAQQQTAARAAAPKPAEPAKTAQPPKPAAPAKRPEPKQPTAAAKPAPAKPPAPPKPEAPAAVEPSATPAPRAAPAKPPAPKPAEAAKPAAPKQVAAVPGEAIERDGGLTITFAPGSSDLPDNAVGALDRLAERLKSDPNLRIQLVGFARTQVESSSQARRLSLFRALSVRTHLMKKGVRSTRMDVRALGNKEDDGPPDRVDLVVPSGS